MLNRNLFSKYVQLKNKTEGEIYSHIRIYKIHIGSNKSSNQSSLCIHSEYILLFFPETRKIISIQNKYTLNKNYAKCVAKR